ncbi:MULTISPECIES: ABC transporter permease [unclassified Clostridium]|uniref:ABC transporter permease n=1 Tax=unclassified Clostridium TaxID=2614128 RepID=UPI0025C5A77E|nr:MULTISPECIES: ABC-2 family transporter protein [unclassified Clostridium]
MLMEVKNIIKLIRAYFKFNLSSAMEYKVSFIIQVLGMIINNASFIFFWWILFNNVGTIGGYGFSDTLMLFAIMSTSFGIAFILFGNIGELTKMIVNGELDSYLIQPKDTLMNILCSKSVISAFGDVIYGIILFIFVGNFDLISIALFLFFSCISAIILSSVIVIVNSLSFYIGNAEGLSGLMLEFMVNFSSYPKGIFKGATKYIIYTIVPAAFTAHIPIALIRSFNILDFSILIGVTVIWVLAAYKIFYKGLKKYESGNLIVAKL